MPKGKGYKVAAGAVKATKKVAKGVKKAAGAAKSAVKKGK
jgi:hypothetical protein